MPGRILIVDDDPALTRSLVRMLAREEYHLSSAASGEEALHHLQADQDYDVVLLDVGLPGMNGYTCCKQLRGMGFRQPVIMLTARYTTRDQVDGLGSGADDYLTKPFEGVELLARIRAQLRRVREYNSPKNSSSQLRIGPGLVLDFDLHTAAVDEKSVHLTSREFDLLALLARHPDMALQTDWLYQAIWGCAPETEKKVLAVTVRRLRMKIETDPNNPIYILTVKGYGYKVPPAVE